MTSFICGHTLCSGPVHLVFAHKCRQNQVQRSLALVGHRSMATFWGTARRSQGVAWEKLFNTWLSLPSGTIVLPYRPPVLGPEDPSYTLAVKHLSIWLRILLPLSPPSKSGQRADIFPLYIFVFSPLNFCLLNMHSGVIWELCPVRNYSSVSIQQSEQGQCKGMEPGRQ